MFHWNVSHSWHLTCTLGICFVEAKLLSYFPLRHQVIDYINLILTSTVNQSWWRHQMETFSASLAICVGNSPVIGEFPAQRPVTRSLDVFFDLRLNKRLSEQSWGWWFETSVRPLWRHSKGSFWSSDTYCPKWHYNMEATSVLLAFCKEIRPVTDGFLSQGPVMQNSDFYLMLARINYWRSSRVENDLRHHDIYYNVRENMFVSITSWWGKDVPAGSM